MMQNYRSMAEAGSMVGMGISKAPELNANIHASQPREPTLQSKIEQLAMSVSSLVEALNMLRGQLDPVLIQQVSTQEKDNQAVDPGSPMMQFADEIANRVHLCHIITSDLLRRAAI